MWEFDEEEIVSYNSNAQPARESINNVEDRTLLVINTLMHNVD